VLSFELKKKHVQLTLKYLTGAASKEKQEGAAGTMGLTLRTGCMDMTAVKREQGLDECQ
jgi:hypothetical protein